MTNKKPDDPFADLDPFGGETIDETVARWDREYPSESKATSGRKRRQRRQKAAQNKAADTGQRKPKQADLLIAIAKRGLLFHNHEDVAFGDINTGGHRETWPVRSAGFRRWLLHCLTI
jgi:hypothetical protein